ncbi:MAG TPA: endonuclease/exonuclease/phosphatase family protein [Candidatus Nanopelagicales bacterium]|nr:endonuclease/exonuclease/phosphatase family protein [Candidatus Nanopelagicales bacterium]
MHLATWNVLAQVYVLPSRYAGCSPDDLAAPTRGARVRERIAALLEDNDVIGLQEIEPDVVDHLRGVPGAEVVATMRGNGKDGVALVSTKHALRDPATALTSDRKRCWAAAEVEGVTVVALHLDPDWSRRGLHGADQARELVAWIDERSSGPVVVMGDLNARWHSATGRVLRDAGFHHAPVTSTAATNGKVRTLDVAAARGIVVRAEPTGLPEEGTPLWLPTHDEPSDHVPLALEIAE